MEISKQIIDLRALPEARQGLAAVAAVRELRPGRALGLLTLEDPQLLMRSLDLQFRSALAWRSEPRAGHWETLVRLASDTPPADALDALVRDHRRLDELLGKALRRLNSGDLEGAAPMLDAVLGGLWRHLRAENEILVPALGPRPAPEALETMLREHAELETQIEALGMSLERSEDGAAPQAWEVEPFVAMLSGTLAKHEHREEEQVFPLWARQLEALAEDKRAALFARLRAAIAS